MKLWRWPILFVLLIVLVIALAVDKAARAVGGVQFRLDVVEVDIAGTRLIESRPIITLDYRTAVVTVYVQADRLFANGFDTP